MSYPQRNPDDYSNKGYRFFRLNTTLISDGDIYDSTQGSKGLAIGPDSDISKVNVAYFDEQVSGLMNQVALTPDRPFPGEILARNDETYSPSNRPGRMLIWPDELYNPAYVPTAIAGSEDGRVDYEVPVLDVIEYFSPAGLAMTGGRNNKSYYYPGIPVPAVSGLWAVIIPYYGRSYACVSLSNNSGGADINAAVAGLYYKPGTGSAGAAVTPIGATLTVADGAADSLLVKASVDGMFDALQILVSGVNIDPADPNFLRVLVSDKEP